MAEADLAQHEAYLRGVIDKFSFGGDSFDANYAKALQTMLVAGEVVDPQTGQTPEYFDPSKHADQIIRGAQNFREATTWRVKKIDVLRAYADEGPTGTQFPKNVEDTLVSYGLEPTQENAQALLHFVDHAEEIVRDHLSPYHTAKYLQPDVAAPVADVLPATPEADVPESIRPPFEVARHGENVPGLQALQAAFGWHADQQSGIYSEKLGA